MESPAKVWVARATIDSRGSRLEGPAASGGVTIITVCVNQEYRTDMDARLDLMGEVARRHPAWVTPETPSLWVFPGGYFGFDASKSRGPKSSGHSSAHQKHRKGWPGMGQEETATLRRRLDEVHGEFPRGAWLAVGVDPSWSRQGAWVLRNNGACWIPEREIVRGLTPLDERKLMIGNLKAAFFVCGEVTGSRTNGGGPFHEREFLTNPARQLRDCGLLVDLAHLRVPGAVFAMRPSPRWTHQRQLEAFAAQGAAMLAHHHGGHLVGSRFRFEHQSNWIVFRGRQWLDHPAETVP